MYICVSEINGVKHAFMNKERGMKRITGKKGFTLAELLIVVAIIGVLVAISIPIFTNNLRKARLATNQANARAAYAAAITWYIENPNPEREEYKDVGYYDVQKGVFTPGNDDGATEPTPNDPKIGVLDISSWEVDTPIIKKAAKKCLGDVVYNKWYIYWDRSKDDGTILEYAAFN